MPPITICASLRYNLLPSLLLNPFYSYDTGYSQNSAKEQLATVTAKTLVNEKNSMESNARLCTKTLAVVYFKKGLIPIV